MNKTIQRYKLENNEMKSSTWRDRVASRSATLFDAPSVPRREPRRRSSLRRRPHICRHDKPITYRRRVGLRVVKRRKAPNRMSRKNRFMTSGLKVYTFRPQLRECTTEEVLQHCAATTPLNKSCTNSKIGIGPLANQPSSINVDW